jgi:hypothetical protein
MANGRILVRNQRFLKPLAATLPGKKTEAKSSSLGTKMVTRLQGKKMEVTKAEVTVTAITLYGVILVGAVTLYVAGGSVSDGRHCPRACDSGGR